MVSHLHPRSRWTMSLFTTTLIFSFLVVGMPHLLPCPVPRRAFAEGEMQNGQRKRRRKAAERDEAEDGSDTPDIAREAMDEQRRRTRECPVPKPGGLVGQIMGFEKKDSEREKRIVRIEPLQRRGRQGRQAEATEE